MRVKVQKLVGKVSPFSGIFFVNKMFENSALENLIDNELGKRGKRRSFSYSDIIKNLAYIFLAGGSYIEDINTYFGKYLSTIPNNNVSSADTILRGLSELKTENTHYVSDTGKSYNFNINRKLNRLNIKSLKLLNVLESGKYYDFYYDNQITPNKKFDAKKTYKKNTGYFPGVATIDGKIVYVENRDGNANVKFKQEDTLQRAYGLLSEENIKINRSIMDAGSYSKNIIEVVHKNSKLFYIRANKSTDLFEKISQITDWQAVEINYKNYEVASIQFSQFFTDNKFRLVIMREKHNDNQLDMFTGDAYIYRSILTNDCESTEKQVIELYNHRGASEKVFDEMNNDFGWKHLPFSFLEQNAVFMIIMAMIRNFYLFVVEKVSLVFEDINPNTRLRRFIFKFIAVAGKWVKQGRMWIIKLFTNRPYEKISIS